MFNRLVVTALMAATLLTVQPDSLIAQDAPPVAPSGPDTGQLYEVEPGRSLYLECIGAGSPTVIFESGAGADSSVWDEVAPAVADATRVCTYDRAGLGKSDPAPHSERTVQDSVDDLHALLAQAEIQGPYVLVGASLGGFIVRLFASQHPDKVAGLVLVDGLPPGILESLMIRLPLDVAQDLARQLFRSSGEDQENIDILASDALLTDAPLPPPVPTIVLANDTLANDLPSDLDWQSLKAIEVAWRFHSREQAEELGGTFVVAKGIGHSIHQEAPEYVIDAVLEVVEAVRDPDSWATPAS